MRELKYILIGQTPVPCSDTIKWAEWFQGNDEARRVGFTHVSDDMRVSTVFLGLDHNFWLIGPPILFETMVFQKDKPLNYQKRYRTWSEAEAGHEKAITYALRLVAKRCHNKART